MRKTIALLALILIQQSLIGQITAQSFEESISEFDVENSFLIIGEAHDVKGTYDTELYIIKELLSSGKTTILIEAGTSESFILNKYLDTKSEDLLNLTRARDQNYKRFIEGIASLTTDYEVKFQGVDFERAICLEYLFNKWFKHVRNPALEKVKKDLLSINEETSAKKIKRKLLKIKKSYNKYEEELTKELGEDSKALKAIIFNPVFQADFRFSTKKRDKGIAKNILSIEAEKLKKSILIFGSNHFTFKNHFGYSISEKTTEELNSILIIFVYKNCKNYRNTEKNYTSYKPLNHYIKDEISEASQISFTIKVNNKLPPFDKKNRFILTKIINQ